MGSLTSSPLKGERFFAPLDKLSSIDSTNAILLLRKFENKLEDEAKLISEAIEDVITISSMNDRETAIELLKKQFFIINKQDTEL